MSSEIRRQRLYCVGLEKGKKFHGHGSGKQETPAVLHLLLLATPVPSACSGKCKALFCRRTYRAKGRVFVTERPVKVLSLWRGFWGPLSVWRFFLRFCCAAAAAVACSFAGASLARVLLGLGVSRTSAACARGFYNPLQRRHREGAVPGLRTRQSSCAAPQLNQLLATVSLHKRSHPAFCGYLLWESSTRAPQALREGALGSLGVIAPDGVCGWNHRKEEFAKKL